MNTVLAILAEPAVFNLVVTLILSGGTLLLGKITMLQKHESSVKRAKDVVAAAVTDLYPVVKALKEANNGKLSPDQRAQMRQGAMSRATEIGKTMGIDVLQVLGPEVAVAVLEQAVSSLKRPSAPFTMPAAGLLPDVPPPGFQQLEPPITEGDDKS